MALSGLISTTQGEDTLVVATRVLADQGNIFLEVRMETQKRRHNWLARVIIWSGITERQTCCVLCKVTMTITSCLIVILISRSAEASKSILIIGLLLDLMRESIDRIIGRPLAAALGNADSWATNRSFIFRVKFMVYGYFCVWFIFVLFISLAYGLSIAAERPLVFRHVFNWVESSLPDLFLLGQAGLVEMSSYLPTKSLKIAELTHNFVSLIILLMVSTYLLAHCFCRGYCQLFIMTGQDKMGQKVILIRLHWLQYTYFCCC